MNFVLELESFSLAEDEIESAAIVTFFDNSPRERTFPGITIVSPGSACSSISWRFTFEKARVGPDISLATRLQGVLLLARARVSKSCGFVFLALRDFSFVLLIVFMFVVGNDGF